MSESIDVKLPHKTTPAQFAGFLDSLILVMYKLSKPTSSKEMLQKEPKLPKPKTVGRGLSFLTYLNLVRRKGGKGIYELTDEGRKIGIALFQENESDAKKFWQEVLRKHPLHEHVTKYIEEKGGGLRGSSLGLGEYLREIAKASWGSTFTKEGAIRLCDLFASKGLLVFNKEEDSISLPKEGEPSTRGVGVSGAEGKEGGGLAPQVSVKVPFGVDIQLKIEIGKDTPIELADKILTFLLKLGEMGIEVKPSQKSLTQTLSKQD